MPESQAPEGLPEKPVAPPDVTEEAYYEEAPPDEYAAAQFADRAMIRSLISFLGMTQETEAPDNKRARLARDMAVIAAYDRVRRICNNDWILPEEMGFLMPEGDGDE